MKAPPERKNSKFVVREEEDYFCFDEVACSQGSSPAVSPASSGSVFRVESPESKSGYDTEVPTSDFVVLRDDDDDDDDVENASPKPTKPSSSHTTEDSSSHNTSEKKNDAERGKSSKKTHWFFSGDAVACCFTKDPRPGRRVASSPLCLSIGALGAVVTPTIDLASDVWALALFFRRGHLGYFSASLAIFGVSAIATLVAGRRRTRKSLNHLAASVVLSLLQLRLAVAACDAARHVWRDTQTHYGSLWLCNAVADDLRSSQGGGQPPRPEDDDVRATKASHLELPPVTRPSSRPVSRVLSLTHKKRWSDTSASKKRKDEIRAAKKRYETAQRTFATLALFKLLQVVTEAVPMALLYTLYLTSSRKKDKFVAVFLFVSLVTACSSVVGLFFKWETWRVRCLSFSFALSLVMSRVAAFVVLAATFGASRALAYPALSFLFRLVALRRYDRQCRRLSRERDDDDDHRKHHDLSQLERPSSTKRRRSFRRNPTRKSDSSERSSHYTDDDLFADTDDESDRFGSEDFGGLLLWDDDDWRRLSACTVSALQGLVTFVQDVLCLWPFALTLAVVPFGARRPRESVHSSRARYPGVKRLFSFAGVAAKNTFRNRLQSEFGVVVVLLSVGEVLCAACAVFLRALLARRHAPIFQFSTYALMPLALAPLCYALAFLTVERTENEWRRAVGVDQFPSFGLFWFKEDAATTTEAAVEEAKTEHFPSQDEIDVEDDPPLSQRDAVLLEVFNERETWWRNVLAVHVHKTARRLVLLPDFLEYCCENFKGPNYGRRFDSLDYVVGELDHRKITSLAKITSPIHQRIKGSLELLQLTPHELPQLRLSVDKAIQADDVRPALRAAFQDLLFALARSPPSSTSSASS